MIRSRSRVSSPIPTPGSPPPRTPRSEPEPVTKSAGLSIRARARASHRGETTGRVSRSRGSANTIRGAGPVLSWTTARSPTSTRPHSTTSSCTPSPRNEVPITSRRAQIGRRRSSPEASTRTTAGIETTLQPRRSPLFAATTTSLRGSAGAFETWPASRRSRRPRRCAVADSSAISSDTSTANSVTPMSPSPRCGRSNTLSTADSATSGSASTHGSRSLRRRSERVSGPGGGV